MEDHDTRSQENWDEANIFAEENEVSNRNLNPDNHSMEQWNEDPFTAFMFGPARPQLQHRNPIPTQSGHSILSNLPEMDLDELMVHIDTLVESINGLKPLFQQAYPLIQQFLKRK